MTDPDTATLSRRKRPVFLPVFLAIQAAFLIWLISDLVGWDGPGRGIGAVEIIVQWCPVDVVIGGGYAIYRLACRRRSDLLDGDRD